MKIKASFFLFSLALSASAAIAQEPALKDRFFLSGDGSIHLTDEKTGASVEIHYRLADGTYPEKGQKEINRVFGIPKGSDDSISLRLISVLDYVEDQYKKPLIILSGYRSPEYNEGLRKKSKLAAKTSLHIEGMAVDIRMPKKISKRIFEEVRSLNCCGIGFYHADSFHLDTGPARFWDEKTSGVGTDVSSHNKLIIARTDQDIYRAGEKIETQLARITDYPIGLSTNFEIVKDDQPVETASLEKRRMERCLHIDQPQKRKISWTIPEDFQSAEKIQLQFHFCKKPYPAMPDEIRSNPISVIK